MTNNQKITVNLVTIEKYGKHLYGKILKEVILSPSKGLEAIFSFTNVGLIRRVVSSLYGKLNAELIK